MSSGGIFDEVRSVWRDETVELLWRVYNVVNNLVSLPNVKGFRCFDGSLHRIGSLDSLMSRRHYLVPRRLSLVLVCRVTSVPLLLDWR